MKYVLYSVLVAVTTMFVSICGDVIITRHGPESMAYLIKIFNTVGLLTMFYVLFISLITAIYHLCQSLLKD